MLKNRLKKRLVLIYTAIFAVIALPVAGLLYDSYLHMQDDAKAEWAMHATQVLKMANNKFQSSRIWNSYAIVDPQSVKRHTTKEEKEALTNIIQLVRFANHQIEKLESLYPQAQKRFNLWYGQMQRDITDTQIAIIRQIGDYIASNGACTIKDIIDDDKTRAAQLINAFGGKQQADEALVSLSRFLLYRKTV
jgi:type I restriction enzyme R subunit